MKSYARLYPKVLELMQQAKPFGSREEAFNWLRDTWVAVHIEAGANKRRIRIMQGARICPEQGWKNIDQEVCYLQSPEDPPVRLYLHRDGTVVLQQLFTARNEIIFVKHGKVTAPVPVT